MNRYSELITVIFLLLAIGAIVIYFVMPADRTLFYVLAGVAVVLRIVQYISRFFGSKKRKHEIPEDLRIDE